MGSCISVVTRAAHGGEEGNSSGGGAGGGTVLEFTMDEAKYAARSSGDMFRDTIEKRAPYAPVPATSPGHASDGLDLLREVAAKQRLEDDGGDDGGSGGGGVRSFTYVALRLRPSHEHHLKHSAGAVRVLCRQLSHTYHYYINPPGLGAAAVRAASGGLDAGALTQGGGGASSSSSSSAARGTSAVVPVAVSVCAWGHALGMSTGQQTYAKDWERVSLAHLPNLERLFLEKAGRTFRFDCSVSHRDDDGRDVVHEVQGEVRYYPHNGSGETLPDRSYSAEAAGLGPVGSVSGGGSGEGGGVEGALDGGGGGDDDGDDDDAEGCGGSGNFLTQAGGNAAAAGRGVAGAPLAAGRVLDVFWSHRLVPESGLEALPFWPSPHTISENRDALGPLWKGRLHGSLFFPWHFPISNNKLRLLATGADGLGGLPDLLADEDLVNVKVAHA